jgi:hypothetical protein
MRLHTFFLIATLLVFEKTARPPQISSALPATTQSVPNPDKRDDRRREIAQMRVLIGQMERNLAQVSTGETPLKHQFDLELQMWQLLVRRMEKQLETEPPDRR